MTPADALRAAGLTVHDVRVAPRPGAWVPAAIVWHHTGTPNPPKAGTPASLRICQNGRSDLPGPLCQWVVGADGDWWWITDGKANHAGAGSRATLAWINQRTSRPNNPPTPTADDSDVGNRYLCGIEVEGTGNWSARVHDSMLRGTRALLAYYGQPADNLVSHREWTRRKTDPAGIDMAAARAWLRTPHQPPAAPQEDDDMPYIANPVTDNDSGQYLVVGNTMTPLASQDEAQQFRNSGLQTKDFEPLAWALVKALVKEVPHP